jgi:hypothetical protein
MLHLRLPLLVIELGNDLPLSPVGKHCRAMQLVIGVGNEQIGTDALFQKIDVLTMQLILVGIWPVKIVDTHTYADLY